MTEAISTQEVEQIAHRQAFALLNRLIESQPQMLAGFTPHNDSGRHVGHFLNVLYDQLVVLSRKNSRAELSD